MDISTRFSGLEKLAAALCQAQKQFKVAAKSGYNPHFKSHYSTLKDQIEATQDGLHANGLSVIHRPQNDGNGMVGVETLLVHISGQILPTMLLLKPTSDSPQAAGSAISYAKRYNYGAITGLAEEDDDGNAASTPSASRPQTSSHHEKPTVVSADPGEYIVKFGKKLAGQKIKNIAPDAILSYISFLQESSRREGKEISGMAKEFIEYAKAFLTKESDEAPPHNDLELF